MQNTLLEIDAAFTTHYKKMLDVQEAVKKQLDTYPYDLTKDEITEAIIQRMYAFWHFSSRNNDLLGRRGNPVSADFFTESCLLFFKTYFEHERHGFKVKSEHNIDPAPNRRLVKPDISIWKDDQLIATVELKVSHGWKGKSIEEHLRQREEKIIVLRPSAWFGVLVFWNYSQPDAPQWGEKYFGLLNHKKDFNHQRTSLTVEHLMQKIEAHANEVVK